MLIEKDNPYGVAVVSGGLDSVTMLHHLVHHGYIPQVLSFNYGQRHKKELDFAMQAAERFNLNWNCIDLVNADLDLLLNTSDSALVNPLLSIPEGHYSEESMKKTVVPNRNMVMMSIAAAVCIAQKGHYVAAGPHNGDAAIYPDCRPGFFRALEDVIRQGNEGFIEEGWSFFTPFINRTKEDIAHEAKRLDVPTHLTWSCYKGGETHCGRCGTCVERLEAIHGAGIDDQTEYKDTEFWRTQIKTGM